MVNKVTQKSNLPGQCFTKHGPYSSSEPKHACLIFADEEYSQTRRRFLVPEPQLFEHWLHICHSDHLVSATL